MNIADIKDKLKEVIVPNNSKEDLDTNSNEEKDMLPQDDAKAEEIPISDEAEESLGETPLRIKTVIVKEEEQREEETKKKRIGAVKVIAGVSIAAVGLAAIIFNSKKKR